MTRNGEGISGDVSLFLNGSDVFASLREIAVQVPRVICDGGRSHLDHELEKHFLARVWTATLQREKAGVCPAQQSIFLAEKSSCAIIVMPP